ELKRPWRQLGILGGQEESVETAAVIDRFQRIGRNPQADRTAKRVGDQRNIEQVGQKPPLGLAVRMADPMADLACLSGQFASPCHGRNPCRQKPIGLARSRALRAAYSDGLGMARTYSGRPGEGQAQRVADKTQAPANGWGYS